MKHKKAMTLAFLLIILGMLHAQESLTAAGGEATGTGGTSSYSIGQIVYTTNISANGSIAQGVQQPYEISSPAGISETNINLELSAYPNPATNLLTLKVENKKFENLTYQLIDIHGKVLQDRTITTSISTIDMQYLVRSNYFLTVFKNKQVVKMFKIIKN